MSNYPPGVTGNEWQIAGGVDVTLQVTCGTVGFDVLPQPMVDEMVGTVREYLKTPRTLRSLSGRPGTWRTETPDEQIARVLAYLETAVVEVEKARVNVAEECKFEGEVDAEVFDLTACWTCPWCGAEHEDDRAFEPDPDAGKDD